MSFTLSTASSMLHNPNSSFASELHIDNLQHRQILEKREHKTNIGSCVFVVESGERRNGGRNEARIDIGKQSKEQTKQYQCVFLYLCFRHEKELQW
jgi:hypothetical protein